MKTEVEKSIKKVRAQLKVTTQKQKIIQLRKELKRLKGNLQKAKVS